MEDMYNSDKVEKRPAIAVISSVASRRPVRKKAKPKCEDFEYDLSNLLKMEAQGYRETQTGISTATNKQGKKKLQPDTVISYDILNKECLGAMDALSRKAVEKAKAAMKTSSFAVYSFTQSERPPSNIFARPMLPKSLSKGDKNSPKKDSIEEKKDSSSANKEAKIKIKAEVEKDDETPTVSNSDNNTPSDKEQNVRVSRSDIVATTSKEQIVPKNTIEPAKNRTITSLLPIKFRRQSLDVMKNPIINKNIKDFTKAGMKTKILVIKPIKLKDGTPSVNSSLKFQTIKLKESNRKSTGDKSDQIVVVKVPNVERNVVQLALQEAMASTTTDEQALEDLNQTHGCEPTDSATNIDTEITNDSEMEEQPTQDINDRSSDINLLCNEDLKKMDPTSLSSKATALKIDNQLSSTNGLS